MNQTKTELYIAVGDESTSLAEGDWNTFLSTVITPLFPIGYTVLDGDGHWKNATLGKDQRLRMKIVIIIHDGSSDASRRIDQIREEWKDRYPCESVLRADSRIEAFF